MGKSQQVKPLQLVLSLCFMVFVIAVPKFSNVYMMTVMNTALIYFVAALGISVMLGMGGQISFSTSAIMGFGAYAYANFTVRFQMNTVLALLLTLVITILVSWILGLILFRLKDSYFTFASIGLVQIMWSIYLNWKPVTGGPDGIASIPPISLFGKSFSSPYESFFILSFFVVVTGFLVARIRNTSLGRSLASVRDNELAAKSLGVNVYQTKVISFIIAGVFAGLAGVLLAHNNQFISASQFTFDVSTRFLIMVMLGGVSSTPGVFIGALLVTMLPEWLRPLEEYIMFVYGIGVILLMIFMPMGLAGLFRSIFSKSKKKEDKSNDLA